MSKRRDGKCFYKISGMERLGTAVMNLLSLGQYKYFAEERTTGYYL